MNNMKWTEAKTLKFISLYQEHPCLWNRRQSNYRNKIMRQKAVEDIVEAMGLDGFVVAEAKRKIKNLKSTYSQEVQKIRLSARSATHAKCVHKSTLKWFNIMDQMMRGTKRVNQNRRKLKPSIDFCNLQVNMRTQNEYSEEDETSLEPEIITEEQSLQPTPKVSSNFSTRHSVNDLPYALNQLRAVNQALNYNEPSVAENEAFCKYVQSSLDKLPQKEALLAQCEIHSILTRFRLNIIASPSECQNSPPFAFTPSPSDSNTNDQEIDVEFKEIIVP